MSANQDTASCGQNGISATENRFQIRVASRMSGISVDTIRMWERRYGFPAPQRTLGGNRTYSGADVRRLTLISRAIKLGYRPGQSVHLSEGQLEELVSPRTKGSEPGARTGASCVDVEVLISHLRSYDLNALRRELKRLTGCLGTRRFVVEVASPLVQAIGNDWAEGKLAVHQEHLLTAALTTHLRSLSQPFACGTGPIVLLATLPREPHALGLEFSASIASLAGAQVEFVGTECPPAEIVRAATALRAQTVALSVSAANAHSATEGHLQWLAENLPRPIHLWLGGMGAQQLDCLPDRIRCFDSWDDFELALDVLARGI